MNKSIEQIEAERIAIEKRVAKAPIVTITGIIDASGSGGCRHQGDRMWRFVAHLCAWRCEDGPVRTQRLRLERWVSEKGLEAATRRAPAWKMIRCRARLLDADPSTEPRALAIRMMPPGRPHADLDAVRDALQTPVHRRVPGIGRVTLDRRIDMWTGRAKWAGGKVEVVLGGDPKAYSTKTFELIQSVAATAATWDARLKRHAAKHLVKLKNEAWREDGVKPITSKLFAQRLKLQNWLTRADRSMEFSFDDGDLFFGHEIVVSVDPKGRLGEPELHG
ncbi:MAG TPA: DUF2262 domain-containing protein [Phycisphaerales bacterium]